MDIKNIIPANSELVVTTVKGGDGTIEDTLGISDTRVLELSLAIDKIKKQIFGKEDFIPTNITFEMMSRIATTPNELFWFAFRLGAFDTKSVLKPR